LWTALKRNNQSAISAVFSGQFRLIAITGFTNAKGIAANTYQNAEIFTGALRHLTTVKWLYHFFRELPLRFQP